MSNRLLVTICLLLMTAIAWAVTPWRTDPNHSQLTFRGTQAGAPFTGTFQHFTAAIQFDPTDLAHSRLDVVIDLASVDTQDKDRDETLQGPDFFDVSHWPQAHFLAEKFTSVGNDKFTANGKLTLRGVTREVPIHFTFQSNASGAMLKGSAQVKRLDFGVGQGEWRDTTWVGDEIGVQFSLQLIK